MAKGTYIGKTEELILKFHNLIEEMQRTTGPVERLKLSSDAKSLIHPEGMGGTFKILIQRKTG